MDWIEDGPVSHPSTRVAGVAAAVIFVAAAVGFGVGMHAVMREGGERAIGDVDQIDTSQAVIARPLVEIPSPTPQAAPTNTVAANTVEAKTEDADEDNDIAAKTAEVQALQAQPAKPQADMDQILTSSSEKPQAPEKPAQDEDSAAKSDVPF